MENGMAMPEPNIKQQRRVRLIPAMSVVNAANPTPKRRRVAAYARVSTDYDEQAGSFDTQVSYYTEYISSHQDWTLVGVYADEGASGTSTSRRDGFRRMIADAMAGKIDLILTKSISRFARNTVDMLTNVRKLKEKNVEVRYEKENISTLDSSGELMITILSSISQEESHNISENIKWSISSYFANGNIMMGYGHFLGYERGEDGRPRVVEAQAKIVREIYRLFLAGYPYRRIAQMLTERGTPTPSGKTSAWNKETIRSILQNEKYTGSALLQKYYVPNFLAKRVVPNDGVKPKYFVENSHEAIISQEIFDLVQQEVAARNTSACGYGSKNVFTGRVFCGECGGLYGSRAVKRQKAAAGMDSTDSTGNAVRETVWRCSRKYERIGEAGHEQASHGSYSIRRKTKKCGTPSATETQLREGFVETLNSLLLRKEDVLNEYGREIANLSDPTSFLEEKAKREEEIARVKAELAAFALDADAIEAGMDEKQAPMAQYNALVSRVENAQTRLAAIEAQMEHQKSKGITLRRVAFALRDQDGPIHAFDRDLWTALVERVGVYGKDASNPTIDQCVNRGEAGIETEYVGIAEYHYKDGRVIAWAIR